VLELFEMFMNVSFRRGVVAATSGRRFMSSLSLRSWATVDPDTLSGNNPCKLQNLVGGQWKDSEKYSDIPDPMNGEMFIKMPDTQMNEIQPFIDSMRAVPKSGVHNPFKNPERYNMYAEVCFKAAVAMSDPEVEDFFIKCIQRVMPKSRAQALGEVHVSRVFLKTFGGDAVRFMARGFSVTGDHDGQESKGYRWPYGATAIVCPFNFPLEIPMLQLMGCLFMGNKPVVKGAPATSLVLEQYIRLLHACGMPKEDVDLLHSWGEPMQEIILKGDVRVTQFTGSSTIAEKLCRETGGKVKIEDAGFDWKIIGPDVGPKEIDYVSWVSDQDAYAMSGQKCSAQSMVFVHKNAMAAGFTDKITKLAARRSLDDLTISPVISVSTEQILEHTAKICEIPGAKVLFGGKELDNHTIPKPMGAVPPTAVYVPLDGILSNEENFKLCTTEIFGPFQIVTDYDDSQVDRILEACERMSHHLTAAVVTNDAAFRHKMIGNTVNGTTYHGLRARTTGAPANHWFGPAGDPRGAGIGSPEAIRLVWSCHREVIADELIPEGWTTPEKAT